MANQNKKKKDPLAAAAKQVVKDTASKAVKQTAKKQTPKQSPKQSPKQNAKVVAGVAKNAVRNAGTSTKKATSETVKTLPKKQAKPFKASDLSGTTGRGVTKQARKQTKSAYTGASQRKAQAKQKEKDIKAGKYKVPNRLSQADEMMLSQEGKNQINYYKDQWEKAKARGDKAGMQKAHEEAEKVRLTNPATVKTMAYEGPTQSQVTMAALQQYAQAMQAGDAEGMKQAKNLAAYAMLNVPKDNREQKYMTGAYSGGTWGDRALEASESDVLKAQGKNFLKSEGAALLSAVPEAAGGYIETVMNAPGRIREGSSQLVVKDPDVDKTKVNDPLALRGQSRYTEEDARAKADHYQAQAEYLKQIAYSTTPLPGVAGRFAVDETAAAGGWGIDLAANTLIPGAGLVSMGARTFGSSVQQAKDYQKVNGTDNDPYADAKAYLYGAAIAGTEIASEKMFGGPWSKIYGKGLLDATVKGAKPTIGKTILKGLLEEGTEEVAADIAQWQAPRIYGGETETLPEMLKGAAYDFTLGAALGGLGGAVTAPGQVRAEKVQNLRRRMEAVGYAKDDIDTAFQRMTVGDMEDLTDSPDSTLEAWVDTVIGKPKKTSQNANQGLAEASGEQSSEQTFEGRQETPAQKEEVSRGKAWDALRSRLRESGVRDAQMLRTIRDRMSAEEMEEAANLRKNDFLEWRDRVTSPDYQPEAREEEEPVENITAETEEDEGEVFENEASQNTAAQITALGNNLRDIGVSGGTMAQILRDDSQIDRLAVMSKDELTAWAQENGLVQAEKAPTKVTPESLKQQSELLAETQKAEPEEQRAPSNALEAVGMTFGKAGKTVFNSMHNVGQDTKLYTFEMMRAYNAGFSGNGLVTLGNKIINRKQATAMWNAGKIDAENSLKAQKENTRNAILYDKKSSGLYEDEYVEKEVKKNTAKALNRISKALGVRTFFADSVGGMDAETKQSIANGSYANGILLIAKDADESVAFVYGHEITHRMKEVSPEAYKKLEKYVMSQTASNIEVRKMMANYAAHGLPITTEGAVEEVVADYVGMMVQSQELLEQFARRVDRNVLQKFLDALKSLARKLTGKEKTEVQKAIKVIENALDTSVKATKKMSRARAISADVLNGDVFVNSETGQKYSIKSARLDILEGKMLKDLKKSGAMSEQEADKLIKNIDNLIDYMVPFADIVDMNEEYTREDRPYFPYKDNSDPLYKISLDFTTLCRKRLLTQAVIERLQTEYGRAITSSEQLKIRNLINEYRDVDTGLQVACAFCYVEAARLKAPGFVNGWLNNPEPIIINYLAQKDKVFKKRIDKRTEDWKEEHGYKRKATKKEMSGKDAEALNAQLKVWRQEYKPTSKQNELIETVKKMPAETFLTEKNLTKLLMEHKDIYDIFISHIRSSTHSKSTQGAVPYYYGDSKRKGGPSNQRIQKMNAENGLRFSSWSDWQVQHMLDMMVAIIDLSQRNAQMHGYTKFPEFIRIFGDTGMQFNMSGILNTVEPIFNKDGTYSTKNFDNIEGVNIDEAIAVRDAFPETAALQCIGVSREQVRALLRTPWIDYVIPYHASGLSKELREEANIIKDWEDFTLVQEAHPIDKNAKPGPNDDAENWHKEPVFSEFMVWDGKDGLDCMKKSAENYVRMCRERGMTPKFEEFIDEEGYWKLLIDRKMINQKTGQIIVQQPVKPIFNFEEAKKAVDREVSEYNPEREQKVYEHVVKNMKRIGMVPPKSYREEMASVGNTLIANVVNGQKLSLKRDATYNHTVVLNESTVDKYLKDYAAESSPNYAQAYIAYMSPNQFLNLTTSIVGRNRISKETTDLDVDKLAEATVDQPFQLRIDHETGEVLGHEGRHRMSALDRSGVIMVPVLLFDSSNKYNKEPISELNLTGQDFGSSRSFDTATVSGVLPLNYANRDEIIKRFATQPTDERIAENYGNQTVRYSLKRDSDYLAAVESGDMETAQKMVDEAAKEAMPDTKVLDKDGNPLAVYHGTPDGGFTEFNSDRSMIASKTSPGFFFTSSREIAEKYYAVDNSMAINGKQLYKDHLNITNPLIIECNGSDWNRIELPDDLKGKGIHRYYNPLLNKRIDSDTASTDNIAKYAKENGYDGVIFRNIRDGQTGENTSDVYTAFKSEQVKSADPVTYDDEGNVIPLSERFDPNKPDIRWSLKSNETYEELASRYGVIPPGERRSREVKVPRKTSDTDNVSQFIRTVMEAGTTPAEFLPTLEDMIASGDFSFQSKSNEVVMEGALKKIESIGFTRAFGDWQRDVGKGVVNAETTAMGYALYSAAVKAKEYKIACDILLDMTKNVRNTAQALQAVRILKLLPPEIQLALLPEKDLPKDLKDRKKDLDRRAREEYDEEYEGEDIGPEYDEDGNEIPKKPRKKGKPTQREVDDLEKDAAKEEAERAKVTFLDKWNAWRYMAMLANFRTHIRNFVGNLGFFPIVMSKNVTATAAEIAIYHTIGKNRGMQRTKGIYNPKAFAFAWGDYANMKSTILGQVKYEGQDMDLETVFGGLFGKPFEAVRKFNSKMLDREDSWFSKPHYANALAQYMAANGITAEMMQTNVGTMSNGKEFTAAEADKARAYAVLEAQKGTYRDLNAFSEMFMNLGKAKDDTKYEKVKEALINGVLPFKKTPANILVRAVEYSPIGIGMGLKKLIYDVPHSQRMQQIIQSKHEKGEELTEKEKNFKPVTVAEALDSLAASASGTVLFRLGFLLAQLGILIAKTDDGDDEQKYFNRLLGKQQWAIEVNDTSYTIDWLAPEIIPMFMGAQYFREMAEGTSGIRTVTRMLDALSGVMDPVLELSCLSGVQQAMDDAASFADGDLNTMVALIGSMGLSYFTQAIPTFAGQGERVFQGSGIPFLDIGVNLGGVDAGPDRMTTFTTDNPDELLSKDMQYLLGKISAKVPGFDYRQIPYVDAWGNTETETNLFKRIVSNMFNPAYVKKIDTRPVNKELQRLYDSTGLGYVLPDPGWKTYSYTDENGKTQKVYLTAEEYVAYSRAKGRNQFELVSKFIDSKAYKSMTDTDRAEVLREIYNYSEYKAQSEYIHDFKGSPSGYTVKDYLEFTDTYKNSISFTDYVVLDKSLSNTKGLYSDNYQGGKKAISYTKSDNLIIQIHDSGVKIPTDQAEYEAFMSSFGVSDSQKGWSKSMAEADLAKAKKKYGITD